MDNIGPGEGGILGIFEQFKYFLGHFYKGRANLNSFCHWLQPSYKTPDNHCSVFQGFSCTDSRWTNKARKSQNKEWTPSMDRENGFTVRVAKNQNE